MAKRKRDRRGVIFENGEAIRAADMVDISDDASQVEGRDRPAWTKKTNKAAKSFEREFNGEPPLDWSTIRMLKAAVTNSDFWELADRLDKKHKTTCSTRGRKRQHNAMDWILAALLSAELMSVRAAIRELNDRDEYFQDLETYAILQRLLKKVWPNHITRRLSNKPITRSQYMHYRNHCLDDEDIGDLKKAATKFSVEMAMFMGMFNPRAGSRTHPDKSQGLAGDITNQRTLYDIWEPDERNLSKYDPDAVKYHTGESGLRKTARGHRDMLIGTRNKYQNERVILSFDGLPNKTPEGDYFVDKVREIVEDNREMGKGLMHAIYDMALYPKNHDDLLDMGVIPISKVARAQGQKGQRRGKAASRSLGLHQFKLPNGETRGIDVLAIDGSACIAGTAANGEVWYKPLKLAKVEEQHSGGRSIFYLHFAIPDYPLFARSLVGATTRVRLNSTKAEIEALPKHQRRTRVLRAFAEGTTDQYTELFGRREDTEATFSHLKRKTRGRARSIGARNHRLDLIMYQLLSNMKALVAYYKRTGADVSAWWGDYSPISLTKREEQHDGSFKEAA